MPETESRKSDHIKIVLEKDVQHKNSAGFEDVLLVHNALPEIDFDDVDTETEFLGKKLTAPIMVSGMTGGTPEAEKINKNLARAAEEVGIGMGVGSQRAMIENGKLLSTYNVRDVAPGILLLGNIGAAQFAKGYGVEECRKAVEMIGADALAIHLNAAQELVQPEGDRNWAGILKAINRIVKELGYPVIAKETGAGISGEVAKKLEEAGVKAVDVSGSGGTSWTAVESFRNSPVGDTFNNWGIPTAVALRWCKKSVKIPVLASGGIYNGLDAAKAIALGAHACTIARPFLRAGVTGYEKIKEEMERIIRELKIAMFLTGSKNLKEFRSKKTIITGRTAEMIERLKLT
ncbi:MAG: type 2 isopentenyl-diphosphate Delta-isomerase [Candidatus Aenigmarchaeota archaeon]|nr:type 2 isopentenyl-diphosphate Delta-isomerase [Candidatus Aenigmarchaeota archaeon]